MSGAPAPRAEAPPKRDRLSPLPDACPTPEHLLALIQNDEDDLVSLIYWCMYASGLVRRGGRWYTRWVSGKHLVLLAEKLVALYRGEIRRLAVSFPPRHGKSRLVSQLGPGWWLGRDPQARVVICSYNQDTANKMSVHARDALAAHGKEAFGLQVNERAAVANWSLYREGRKTGGGLRAVGVGGGITGGDVDLFVLDDMYKGPEDSGNASIRAMRLDWVESVVNTRLEPWSKALFMGTRWHQEDAYGWLKKNQGKLGVPWEFLVLPAIAEENDPLGREPGEVLWEERFGVDYYEEQRANVSVRGPYVWDALYQCRPTSKEGSTFRRAWLRSYEAQGELLVAGDLCVPLARLRRFATVDLAGSKRTRADFTVITTFGIDVETRTLWVLDVVRRRLESPDIIGALREVQQRMRPVSFYVERAAPQLNLVHKLKFAEAAGEHYDPRDKAQEAVIGRAMSMGIPVVQVSPGSNDKFLRAGPVQTVMKAGRLLTPVNAPWLGEFVDELLAFGDGAAHDDQVDTLSYGVQVFTEVLAALAARERQEAFGAVPLSGGESLLGGGW